MPEPVPGIVALLVMGVSGSGKSTVGARLAERLGWPYEDGDDLHPKRNIDTMRAGHPLTDADRKPWLDAIAARIDTVRAAGGRLVMGCSLLKRAYRDRVTGGRTDVRLVYLKGGRDLIAARIAGRKGHFMPPGLLDSQFATLEEPAPDEHAIAVSVAPSPPEIVDSIIEQLAQEARA